MPPRFLRPDEVLLIHKDQVERYGGSGDVRDLALLDSAVAMPQTGVADEHAHGDLFAMAAAYLFHIVRNHPFVDGSKRTGAAPAIVFLLLNGVALQADEEGLEHIVRCVAQGKADKTEVAGFLRGMAP